MNEAEFFNVELDESLKAGGEKGPVTALYVGPFTLFLGCLIDDPGTKKAKTTNIR